MRIAVCSPQVPFERGGAELLAERLTFELKQHGHDADLVTIPFKWYPGARILSQAFLWRLVDLEEVDGRPVDLVIATKFPSYVIRHPNKVVWLVHQFRQAYELDRTDLGQFSEEPEDRALRRSVQNLDRIALGEAAEALRDLRQRRRPARAGARAGGRAAAAAAAGAAVPHRQLRRLRPLRQPARPCEADRPPARGGRARPVAARRDRRRRPRPRAARVDRARPRARRTRHLRRPCRRRRADQALRNVPRRLLRPRRRGLRDGPRTRPTAPRSRSSRRWTPDGSPWRSRIAGPGS